jgi:hypothetical protein
VVGFLFAIEEIALLLLLYRECKTGRINTSSEKLATRSKKGFAAAPLGDKK